MKGGSDSERRRIALRGSWTFDLIAELPRDKNMVVQEDETRVEGTIRIKKPKLGTAPKALRDDHVTMVLVPRIPRSGGRTYVTRSRRNTKR